MKMFRYVICASVSLMCSAGAIAQPVSPESHIALAPDLAINARGEIALMWVDRAPEEKQNSSAAHDNHLSATDLYVSISRDGGKTFSSPVKVNREAGVVWGQSVSRPRIVSSKTGTWHVSYTANEVHPTIQKTALTMHYTRSIDDGASFEPARRLSTLTDNDLSHMIHGGFISAAAFGSLTSAPDGSVHAVWIDTRLMKTELDTGAMYAAVSRDDGKSFSQDKQLLQTNVCPCCQMTAVADEQSNILIGFRNISGDNIRQSTITRLDAKTGAIGQPVSTGGAPWQIAACPLKPTVIAVQGSGIYTAVYNGGAERPGVYFSASMDGAQTFATAALVHPEAAVSDAPAIAVNDKYALLAWHAKTSGPRRVYYRMYDLKGQPKGQITELTIGQDNAQNPVVATRADGKFQIAWVQSNRIQMTVLPSAPSEVAVTNN